MNVNIKNTKGIVYYIFLDDIYLDFCIEADDELNYAVVYISDETEWITGNMFKEPYNPLIYKKVFGNIDIIKGDLAHRVRATSSYGVGT